MSDMHLSFPEENDPDQYINKAKRLVLEELTLPYGTEYAAIEIYVVWFSKTLQNWKALLSTNIPNGRYYEITYNGDKKEAYVDTYEKRSNTCRSDDPSVPVVRTDKYDEGYRIPIPSSSIKDIKQTSEGIVMTVEVPNEVAEQIMRNPSAEGWSFSTPDDSVEVEVDYPRD